MGCNLHDLHIIGDDELLEPAGHGGGPARLEIQQQFLRQPVDVQVALHPAFGRDERGVAALAGGEIAHVVGHLAVEKADAIRPGEAEAAAEAEVEHAGGLAQRGVFRRLAGVTADGFAAADLKEAGAKALMEFAQRECDHDASVTARAGE